MASLLEQEGLVLVTGAGGYIGGRFVPRLRQIWAACHATWINKLGKRMDRVQANPINSFVLNTHPCGAERVN